MLYFDNAATTRPDPEVLKSYMKVNETLFFNPNSPHVKGVEAARLLEKAREQIKSSLNLREETLIFTSGATESNNMALKGATYQKKPFGKTIITSVPVSYTHLTLPTIIPECRSRWSPYH